MRKLFVFISILAVVAGGAVAQDTGGSIETDEDALFGSGDDMFADPLITEAEETEEDLGTSLLVSEDVEIGGRFSFNVESSSRWSLVEGDESYFPENLTEPARSDLSTSLSARLHFDARPDEDFRVFGKMTASYPFQSEFGFNAADSQVVPVRALEDVFRVEELFSDFNWNDKVFFRGGKQNMNWGVGYFYSPADLLSIAEIDPEDPEADREGPVAVKANIPIGIHNLYFYALPASVADPEPLDIGVAAKGELVVGSGELGAGVIYQRDIAPAGMATASFSLGDFDLFAEGVVSYGSNRTFVVETGDLVGVAAETRGDEFFFNGTAGFRWSDSVGDEGGTASVVAQYLYNGEGYSDPSVITDNPFGIGLLLEAGELSTTDLGNTGRHYAAANAGWSGILGSEINASVLWIQNFTDMSAFVTPSISRTILDNVNLSFRMPMTFGDETDELSFGGSSISLALSVSIGGGSF